MINGTKEKMKMLKLHGMIRIYETLINSCDYSGLTIDEALGSMIDAEWDERYNKRLTRLIHNAGLKFQASLEHIDYRESRNLDKKMIIQLAPCSWIEQGKNIVLTGSTGTGKSYLACALAKQACVHEYKTKYFNCLNYFNELKFSKAEGTYFKKIREAKKADLIILDDFGLEVLDQQSRLILLEILEARYGGKSTIISSQLPFEKWHDIIGEPTIADAVCDRIIHTAFHIKLEGDTMRRILK